jgi:hypothetical protein
LKVFDEDTTRRGGVMNRTRKLALGLGMAAALLAGGAAVTAPALAQAEPQPPAEIECPYECPHDAEGMMHEYRYGPDRWQDRSGQQDQTGQQDQLRQRDRDGTCQLTDDDDSQS